MDRLFGFAKQDLPGLKPEFCLNRFAARLNRLLKRRNRTWRRRLKPAQNLKLALLARLKSCPVTKRCYKALLQSAISKRYYKALAYGIA